MLQCPSCKLMSPDDAESCECGYRFPPSENRKYFLNPENKEKKSTQTIWIVVLLAIISIFIIGWVIFSFVSIEEKYGSIFKQEASSEELGQIFTIDKYVKNKDLTPPFSCYEK